MEQTVFVANPTRLLIAAAVGIIVLLILIIKFKLHPVISMMIAAIIIGVGAGMPLTMISDTVEKGVGKTLQGIALLVGLGSMFGGILEVSGGAQRIAQTLIDKLGQKKAGIALGITGLVIGTTVFFEAGSVLQSRQRSQHYIMLYRFLQVLQVDTHLFHHQQVLFL